MGVDGSRAAVMAASLRRGDRTAYCADRSADQRSCDCAMPAASETADRGTCARADEAAAEGALAWIMLMIGWESE